MNRRRLDVFILVNDSEDTILFRGDPLTVSLRISNPSLLEAEYHNAMVDKQINELQEKLKSGKISHENFQRKSEELMAQKIKVEPVTLGNDETPWYHLPKFYVAENDEWMETPWKLTVVKLHPSTVAVTIDSSTNAFVDYVVEPHVFEKAPSGKYRMKAKVLGAESNTVVFEVSDAEPPMTEDRLLRLAYYYTNVRQYDIAEQMLNQALSIEPHSINVLTAIAQHHEAIGNFEKAMENYRKALEEFKTRFPDDPEGPRAIISGILRLMEKLKQE